MVTIRWVRALSALGFLAFFHTFSHAQPSISGVSGTLEKGEALIISGEGFTEKANPKPYFVWEADSGTTPREVGRHTTWSGKLNGELTTEIVSPNSSQAFRYDHYTSGGAALAGVDFASDTLYVFRRTYEDFDTAKDFAIRTRVKELQGTIEPGQLVKGLESGATGVVLEVRADGPDRWAVYYNNVDGTINDGSPVDFQFGEPMETKTATFVNAEGSETYPTGTYRTFNFKTIRMWNTEYKNNAYAGTGRSKGYDVIPEYTDGKLWNGQMDIPMVQRPQEWKSEELYYRASDLGIENGMFNFRMDNTKSYDHPFVTRDSQRPGKYNILYQSQVSNGAQPESYIYYDHLYIDDTWHQVALCSEPTWDSCKDKALQIPTAWGDGQIEVEFNPRHLDPQQQMYIYVMNGNREVNSDGYAVCSKCPSKATGISVQ